jgi:hypothetical protein
MHEILVHHYLTDNHEHDPIAFEHREDHNQLKNEMGPERYKGAHDRAKHASVYIKNYLLHGQRIKKVERTSQGVEGESQTKNPSDLVVHHDEEHEDPQHSHLIVHHEPPQGARLGLSLKGLKSNSNPVLANPGVGEIENLAKIDLNKHYNEAKEKYFEKYPEHRGFSAKKLKELAKTTPEHEKLGRAVRKVAMEATAKDLANAFNGADKKQLSDFIREHVLRAKDTEFPVHQVTTHGEGNKVKTHSKMHVSHFNHILHDEDNITAKAIGNKVVFFHKDHGKFASLEMKTHSSFGTHLGPTGKAEKPEGKKK